MKKLLTILLISLTTLFVSCNLTTMSEDMMMLQKKYDYVYRVNEVNYICYDSTKTSYHIIVNLDGNIRSTIKIHPN